MGAATRGGGFVVAAAEPESVATPEDLGTEERFAGETAREFVQREVLPRVAAMEAHDWEVARGLIRQAGDLGLLGAGVPEAFGGLGLRRLAVIPVVEAMALEGSFAVTVGAQTGIGMEPLLFFGTAEQKGRYLPDLVAGRHVAAYSLTEAGSGSDALAARTVAVPQPDGGYRLRGAKQWTTNGGFADLYTVYAKVDGQQFTAFLVERGFPGVSTGPEERKMGLHASSTVSVRLDDVPVPAANVLHRVGAGHQVAFGILNLGRFKLGAGCVGGARHLLAVSAAYAGQRQQFGRPIASFPLVQQMMARMAVATYALESAVYRVGGLLDEATAALDLAGDCGAEAAAALGEFAVECSAVKVLGSETMDRVVDEALQLHGGYGFTVDFGIERAYRDSRINRIFEGTNEINRLLIPGTLLRRALGGGLPLAAAARAAGEELVAASVPESWEGPLGRQRWLCATARQLLLAVAGQAAQRYGQAIEGEQEVLAHLADMAIQLLAAESATVRAGRALQRQGDGGAAAEAHRELCEAAVEDAFTRVLSAATAAAVHALEGDALRLQLSVLRRFGRVAPLDGVELGRRIAARVLEAGGYPIG